MRKKCLLVSIIFLFCLNFWLIHSTRSNLDSCDIVQFECDYNLEDLSSSYSSPTDVSFNLDNLTMHDPITITHDGMFSYYSLPGNGTEVNPYIIENYHIVADVMEDDYGIYISGTSSYFVIRNNFVTGLIMHIKIEAADNCLEISNNLCNVSSDYGIYISSSTSTGIIKDNVISNQWKGIYVLQSTTFDIINNTCNYNEAGIYVDSWSTCNVLNNTCNFNELLGIKIDNANPCHVKDNICNSNSRAISFTSSPSCNIMNNTCIDNENRGINLGNTDDCLIVNNSIINTYEYGIELNTVSDNNRIYHNILVNNKIGFDSQAYDEGNKNEWYDKETKSGNYWEDLGDKCTYLIEGPAKSKDLYPLNSADSCSNPITVRLLSTLLPIGISVIVLSFVTPKYIIPFTKAEIIPRMKERRARNAKRREELLAPKTVSCTNCNYTAQEIKFCPKCGTPAPREKIRLIDRWRKFNLLQKTIIIVSTAVAITIIVLFGIVIEFATGW